MTTKSVIRRDGIGCGHERFNECTGFNGCNATQLFYNWYGEASSVTRITALETQLVMSGELGYVSAEETAGAATEIVEMQKMFAAIRRKLAARCSDEGQGARGK